MVLESGVDVWDEGLSEARLLDDAGMNKRSGSPCGAYREYCGHANALKSSEIQPNAVSGVEDMF